METTSMRTRGLKLRGAWRRIAAAGAVAALLATGAVAGAPAANADSGNVVPDAKLKTCINGAMQRPADQAITAEDLAGIEAVDCEFLGIESIEGLQHAAALRHVRLSDNAVADASPLAGLTALEEVDLSGNPIADLTPLAGKTTIRLLDLSGDQISDLSPLATLTGLVELDLSGNRYTNIAPLGGLTGLETLYLSGARLTDASALSPLVNLKNLYMSGNVLTDLSPLAGMTKMERLWLSGSRAPDPTPLAGMTNLVQLRVNGNPFEDISAFAGMTKLEELDISKQHLSDLSPLAGMTKLERLIAFRNQVTDLSPLAGLTSLKEVDLSKNRISDVSALASLPKLWMLNLSENGLENVAPLGTMASLAELTLNDNEISDVSALADLVGGRGFEKLSVEGNKIADFRTVAAASARNPHTLLGRGQRAQAPASVAGSTTTYDVSAFHGAVGKNIVWKSGTVVPAEADESGELRCEIEAGQAWVGRNECFVPDGRTVSLSDDGKTASIAEDMRPVAGAVLLGSWNASDATQIFGSFLLAPSYEDSDTCDLKPGPASFEDVPASHPFHADISWLSQRGITTGWADGTFRPAQPATRGAFAAFLYRMACEPEFEAPATSPFPDVATSHPFYEEIAWAASKGIAKGYSDGTFRPEAKIQRDALAAFLYRFAGEPSFTPTQSFADTASSEHKLAIDWLATTGISTGWPDGTFRPASEAERGAIAAFLHRFSEKRIPIPVK